MDLDRRRGCRLGRFHHRRLRGPSWALAILRQALGTWALNREWALSFRLGKTITWALTREWALSFRLGKTITWALTREWALARETTVLSQWL